MSKKALRMLRALFVRSYLQCYISDLLRQRLLVTPSEFDRSTISNYMVEPLVKPKVTAPSFVSKMDMNAILEGNMRIKCPSYIKIVRIFTSSTFTDTKFERNALMTRVYPHLKEFCKSRGFEFQVVDMRWGVRDESTADHKTSELCMKEIEACQELSTGPNFVTFLGQKYGYRPFPVQIVATEFEQLLEAVENLEDRELLKFWFYRDDNNIPAVYVLQPITVHLPYFNNNEEREKRSEDRGKWWNHFERMQIILRQAALSCLDEKTAEKYLISVTEHEIHNGILNVPNPEKHCLWFRRTIKHLKENAIESKNISRFYIDILDDNLDKQAVELLEDLKERRMDKSLNKENIIDYTVTWDTEKGLDPTNLSEHEDYISSLCNDFQARLISSINDGINEKNKTEIKDPLYIEIIQHISTCQEKCKTFHGRDTELSQIKDYLTNDSRFPLVVYGESGCGKTSLVAMAARDADHGTEPRPMVVLRFFGTTQQSSNIRTALHSICQQICRLYGINEKEIPEVYTEMIRYFGKLLEKTSSKPLVLVLDSLDQLSEDYGARQLAWLPIMLPHNVKLVVSTLPNEKYCCLPILEDSIEEKTNFVHVPQLPRIEASNILLTWLNHGGRTLTLNQKKHVQYVFSRCSLALFVKLTFDQVFQWHSYNKQDDCILQATVKEAINEVFRRLEYKHGKLLVSHALSYITQSKHGISDPEMEDLLSLDDEVLNDVYQYWTPPSRRLPPLLWIRIKTELGSYIVSRGADNTQVNTWYHRQFIETASERYLTERKHATAIYKNISEYFLGIWAGKEKPYLDKNGNLDKANRLVARQPLQYETKSNNQNIAVYNLRKFSELPNSLVGAKMKEDLKYVLCDYEWISKKLCATSFRDVIADFIQASEVFPDDEELVLVRETLQLSTTALAENPAQLSSQLVGRLLRKLRKSENEDMKHAKRLVFEQAYNGKELSLIPDKVCLTEPGGAINHNITGHTSFSNVYLTRDKKRIISASYDGSLKVFDARYGYLIRSTEGVGNMPKWFEVDEKEEFGITSCSGILQVWKLSTGRLLGQFPSSYNVSPITLINDDVVCIREGSLDVFNFKTGVNVGSIEDSQIKLEAHWHQCRITSLPNGDLIAYARDNENTVNILNYKTGSMVHQILLRDIKSIRAMAVSSTGVVYAVAYDKGPIVSFDIHSGTILNTLNRSNNLKMIATLKITPNDRFLAINMYQDAVVWDLVEDKQVSHVYHPCPLNKISLGPDGRILVTAGFDFSIRVFDLKELSVETPSRNTIDYFVEYSSEITRPNGRYSIMLSLWGYLSIWNNANGEKLKEIHGLSIDQAKMIDSKTALISTNDELKILDLPSAVVIRSIHGKCAYDNGHKKRVLEPAIIGNERVMVPSAGRHYLKIMSLSSGKLLDTLKTAEHTNHIDSLLVSRNNETAVCLMDGHNAIVWDIANKKYQLIPGLRKKGGFINGQNSDISDDGLYFINIDDSGGSKEVARVYDLQKACLLYTLPTHGRKIHCVAIATIAKRVLTGTKERCLSIWDLETGASLYYFSDYDYPIHKFIISFDGRRVLTSSMVTSEQSMRVYDVIEGKLLAAFTPEQSWRNTFHVDSKIILCKPGFTDLVKFFLTSESLKEDISFHQDEHIDWGEPQARIHDESLFHDDGDDDLVE